MWRETMRIPGRPPTFPWRERNRFELLPQGSRYLPAMLQAIEDARAQVALEAYWFASGAVADRFVQALADAARRGVRVLLLIDDYGSSDLESSDRRRLTSAGVVLARFNPLRVRLGWGNLVRDHRKLLLVDDRLAFVGGAGLADPFDGADGWRENMLRIEGECVADWWALFHRVWRRWSEVECPQPAARPAGGTRGRALAGGPGPWRPVLAAALADIARARERVWLVTPYFLPPMKLRRALARARRRGCDVRLLLPDAAHCDVPAVQAAGRRYYDWLLRRSIRVFEYGDRMLHQKVLLTDGRATLGSCNFDRWGLRWNLEANQALQGGPIVDAVAGMLAADFERCREVTFAEYERRSWSERLREAFWSWVDAAAARAAQRRLVHEERISRRDG
ncbi:MAG: phospholipase D-like domain-containing protein [Halofilum sp. (in: g-proteobacteria)]|nr:phospholipase D-like domain-containing protein [Halofilum sp. (in: g-proteobacteria)]